MTPRQRINKIDTTSKEIIDKWREWNKDQAERGKTPEPFFSRWLDDHFTEENDNEEK